VNSPTEKLADEIRRTVIEQSKRANVGHIGSSLSIADIVAALFGSAMRIPSADDPERDRFVLSKGHAALAVYAALYATGRISADVIGTYCSDGTMLAAHPEPSLDGIDFATGSLGHGLSMGAGAALGARWRGSRHRVFVLISDAECNEGSLWEAVMFSAHHRLSNLIAILDLNGQQALGYTADVLELDDMAGRWRAFGWDVHEVDGHDPGAIAATISRLDGDRPHVLIADTTFGKGVSYMESQIKWHYWPMSDDEYEQALSDLAAARSAGPRSEPPR
jgi:transketolase